MKINGFDVNLKESKQKIRGLRWLFGLFGEKNNLCALQELYNSYVTSY